jgi:diaminohydroxyphosphoribosylaminopyrimidine deaminase/5-amino-6-(5-phosphoribosylamino)uracil reductase
MRRALALAQGMLGRTAPNPSVGCVIVRDGQIIAEAATGAGGRPHAEEQALAGIDAQGADIQGADVFVTLEPCAERSSGAPSCAQLLSASGAARVVIAAADPHPNAAGRGARLLRTAGIAVETGLCAAEAARLNAGFFALVATGRPLVIAAETGVGFDAELLLARGETPLAALERAGRAGLTRVWTPRGGALAAALRDAGLLADD